MKFYIEIKNNSPVNHPVLGDNLVQIFGAIPNNWELFIRLDRPVLNLYEVFDNNGLEYVKVNEVYTDNWSKRNMTSAEKTSFQQPVIDTFNTRRQAENWSTWALDEATCTMQPPIPRPDPVEGKLVFWCGADANWKDTPARPEGEYKFDFIAWAWVTI